MVGNGASNGVGVNRLQRGSVFGWRNDAVSEEGGDRGESEPTWEGPAPLSVW